MGNKPLKPYSSHINIDKFLGKWYVIAVRPTPFEKGAFNPTEQYSWKEKGASIDVDFTFNKNALDGPLKSMPQVLYPRTDNGDWRVKTFSWAPVKAYYTVMDIGGSFTNPETEGEAELYRYIVVGHPSRKWFWIMSRETKLDADILEEKKKLLQENGFDVAGAIYPKHG